MSIEFFTHDSFGAVLSDGGNIDQGRRWSGVAIGIGAKSVVIIADAAKNVEDVTFRLDDVVTETTAVDLAKIEVLELVGFIIGEGKNKQTRAKVEIASNAGAERIGCCAAGRSRVVIRKDVGGVER